jgi:hypothetical protein
MNMIKSRNRYPSFLLLTAVVGIFALALWGQVTPRVNATHGTWAQSRASQLVLFAVLEGLYRDGVSNEDLDHIIPPGKNGHDNFDPQHFVYACPLCHPAFEAFRLYRHREDFYGFKGRVDTFGPGLGDAVTVGLRDPDAGRRRQAIEGLINRWVRQRLDLMRLTAAEREAITREMEQGRKKGMNGLKQASQTRTNCPICDGSFGACKLPAR